MYNNFEISLVVFMPNITTNHAITYTNTRGSNSEFTQQDGRKEETAKLFNVTSVILKPYLCAFS